MFIEKFSLKRFLHIKNESTYCECQKDEKERQWAWDSVPLNWQEEQSINSETAYAQAASLLLTPLWADFPGIVSSWEEGCMVPKGSGFVSVLGLSQALLIMNWKLSSLQWASLFWSVQWKTTSFEKIIWDYLCGSFKGKWSYIRINMEAALEHEAAVTEL